MDKELSIISVFPDKGYANLQHTCGVHDNGAY